MRCCGCCCRCCKCICCEKVNEELPNNETLDNKFKYEYNYVGFNVKTGYSGHNIVTSEFIVTGFSVTSGQDPDGNISIGKSVGYILPEKRFNFILGRKDDRKNTTWLVENKYPLNDNYPSAPNEKSTNFGANFAVAGTLKLKLQNGEELVLSDFVFYQYYQMFHNYWGITSKQSRTELKGLIYSGFFIKGTLNGTPCEVKVEKDYDRKNFTITKIYYI